MGSLGSARARGLAVLPLALVAMAPRSWAQMTAGPPRPHKSVYGTLESVDPALNRVVMKSNSGEKLAWSFEPAVVAEVARFKPGSSMVVIYRPIDANDKRVTAVAFPGSASTPLYLNMTDSRVVLRTAPEVGGACGKPDAGPVTDSVIPSGGTGEAMDACWCCAESGKSCRPENKTGRGKALLVACFE
ncbi:MAG TPA: hypothetical protein VN461_06520 [Vicinamibacteria bacterium]|nr:hypothetical protein [Vicinamibacteria bacterium]